MMPEVRSRLEGLRRDEAEAKREWEFAVQAVRAANETMHAAHQKYLQAWKALSEATLHPTRGRPLSAEAS
jgi:hypothetical protein